MLIDLFLDSLRAAALSKETITLRRYHLVRVQRDLGPLEDLTREDLIEFMATEGWSREYRRSMRASLRKFYAWAERVGAVEEDPAKDLPHIQPRPPMPRPTPSTALEQALQHSSERVHLMIRLASEAGLRRAEVAGISHEDLLEDLGGWSLRVHGKGDKERIVPLSDSLAREVRSAMRERWLFPNGLGGHLTPGHVGKLVSAELPEGITMHTLRHRFATRVYAASSDLLATQQLLGHSSPATTQNYVRIDGQRLRAVAALAA